VYAGMRPGERINELIIGSKEKAEMTEHKKIMLVKTDHYDWAALKSSIQHLIANLPRMSQKEIRDKLFEILNHTPLILNPSTKSEGDA
ncbi:MAG: hypothetical protein N2513_06605, partial [Deltaproteobacteria bacterium]|nr:hypothetical protein [Deltaproteobacteria bacterium]